MAGKHKWPTSFPGFYFQKPESQSKIEFGGKETNVLARLEGGVRLLFSKPERDFLGLWEQRKGGRMARGS